MPIINDPTNSTRLQNILNKKLGVSWQYDKEATTSDGLANYTVAIRVGSTLYFAKSYSCQNAKQREHNALEFLSTKNFYVPQVITLGDNFLLLTSVGLSLPKQYRTEAQLFEIGRNLRQLHNFDTGVLSDAVFTGSQAARLNVRILENFRRMPRRRSLLHGDVTWSNIVFANSGEIAFIDFEEAAIGHPLVDLSLTVVECCWDPLNVDYYQPALMSLICGYNDLNISDWLFIRSQQTHMSACEFAAEELLSWSRANDQNQLSHKYSTFIEYLQKRQH